VAKAGAWLEQFPDPGVQPQTAFVPGHPLDAQGRRQFNELRDNLLRDSEELPAVGPVRPSAEFLRLLDKPEFAAQFIDAAGNRRTSWFRRQATPR
jgi:hypothetical protein